MKTLGYAAYSSDTPLAPYAFDRRELGEDDVAIDILFCGVCHSDLHATRNDWHSATYPMVPGHEIVGRVTATGPKATRYKAGDTVAIGCMVDSCGQCDQCDHDDEQYCRTGWTSTYGSPDRVLGGTTQGGYSRQIVCKEKFVLSVPAGLDPAAAAPLLCAGITTWSPLRHWGVGKGSRVGVIGLGGLGHMAVKFAVALGAEVTVISRSADKEKDARDLGAHRVLLSTDQAAMAQASNGFDVIIDTIPVKHDVTAYLPLVDIDGSMILVGQIGPLDEPMTYPLLMGRRRLTGSIIGGLAETQEMLDFCAQHEVLPEIEIIRMDEINEAFERMERSDVRYRFVIDLATLEGQPSSR